MMKRMLNLANQGSSGPLTHFDYAVFTVRVILSRLVMKWPVLSYPGSFRGVLFLKMLVRHLLLIKGVPSCEAMARYGTGNGLFDPSVTANPLKKQVGAGGYSD